MACPEQDGAPGSRANARCRNQKERFFTPLRSIQNVMSSTVYRIDPLLDPRWPAFLAQHPNASVFHTPQWLAALRQTYGYQPVALTTSTPGEELKNGIVFCRVQNWLMGCRIVSLPFSDHCQPLVDDPGDLALLVSFLKEHRDRDKWRYIELRPLVSSHFDLGTQPCFSSSETFSFHRLNLRPDLVTIFSNFHKSCVQRKIRRAEREHLEYEAGRSDQILARFYDLLLLTRRRHQLPPQPLAWFRNLADCLGDRLVIRIVSKDGQPIAGILTMFFKNSLVYKYGCSDARYHNLGGMPLLFWRAIQEGKELGAQEFDLGRSEVDNPGLVNFKEHLGAARSQLVYLRIEPHRSRPTVTDWKIRYARKAFSHMPNPCLKLVGNLFYRYIG